MFKLQERPPALKPSTENIQHFKKFNLLNFFYVCGSFLPSWIQIQIRILGPIESGSNPNPEPQH
jgi:hypothetical protein